MEKQVIVSIGREYGSAGHVVAHKLADKLGIEVLDRNLLEQVAGLKSVDTNNLSKYDEKPKLRLFSRTVRGHSNSPEQNVAEMQFALLKSKAADGDSFVVVGRCADDLFRNDENFISIFIYAGMEARIKRVIERHPGLDRKGAIKKIEMHDKKRAAYHDYFCKSGKWGDRKSYELCIDASRLGVDSTSDLIYNYIQQRIGGSK